VKPLLEECWAIRVALNLPVMDARNPATDQKN
jgi:hypothetical protein